MSVRDQPVSNLSADTQEILAALPDTIVQIDGSSRLVAVNRPESPVFRTTPAPRDLLETVVDPGAAPLLEGLIRTAAQRGAAEGEYEAGGRWFRVTARQLRSAPVTMLVFQDLTVRRNAERALTESIGDKTSVLKSISHQLGTPMIAVLGYANLLTDPDLDEATRDAMAQHMTDRAWELAGMVENLQAMAQTELGDLRVVRVPVDLTSEVNGVIESMGARGSRVTVTGDRPVIATGDPARIRQIVRSLLANAFTHGTEPVTVDVTASSTRAVVGVKDRGPGLKESLEGEIFSRTGVGGNPAGGAGIGLWTARGLAHLMGGNIEYGREHGLTVFRLVMPPIQAAP
jgi:signal transduction histidine kinase